jgi:hypothetical protein
MVELARKRLNFPYAAKEKGEIQLPLASQAVAASSR